MTTINVVLLAHVFLAVALIGLILIQHGKGADAGAAFGSGASSTVFGSAGSASFLTRATKWLAILFFITSGSLAYLSRSVDTVAPSLMDDGTAIERQLESDLPPVAKPVDETPEETTGDE